MVRDSLLRSQIKKGVARSINISACQAAASWSATNEAEFGPDNEVDRSAATASYAIGPMDSMSIIQRNN